MSARRPQIGDFVFGRCLGSPNIRGGVLIDISPSCARLQGRYEVYLCEPEVDRVADSSVPAELRDTMTVIRQQLVSRGVLPVADRRRHRPVWAAAPTAADAD